MQHALLASAVTAINLPSIKLPSLNLPSLPLSSLPDLQQLQAYGDAASACAAVASSPDDAEGWRRLGKLLHGKGRLEFATKALSRATELDPQDAQAFIDLANAERSIGRFDASTAALLSAAEITGKRDQALCYYRSPTSTEAATAPPAASASLSSIVPGSEGAVWTTRLASAEECEWAISTCEAFNTARGGWGNPPPRYAPAGTVADNVRAPHMLVADCPELLTWLNGKLESVVWPALSAQFGSKAAEEMWLYDAFVLRFDNQPNQQGLGVHVDDDGLGLSINALLSSPDDFDGGGTFFEDENLGEQVDADGNEADVTVGFTVTPEQGELVSHHGGLRHSSVPTTGGMRYILVAFLRAPSLLVEPPEFVQSYCPNAQASAAAAAGR